MSNPDRQNRFALALTSAMLILATLVPGCGGGGGGGGGVAAPAAPAGLAYPAAPTLFVGVAMTRLAPTSGGGAPTSYAVSPPLPAGIGLDGSTGVVAGTPTAVTALATYTITASNAGGSATAALSLAVEALPVPLVAFALADSTIAEGAGTATLTVALSVPTAVAVTIPFTVAGTATAGGDFTAPIPPLVIPAGATSGQIAVPILDDGVAESAETVLISLQAPTNGTLGTRSTHTLTIQDDDGAPTLAFANAALAFIEGSGGQVITITLTPTSSAPATVSIALAGSATPGPDYVLGTNTVTFLAGESSKQVALTIADDTLFEGDETIVLTLTNPVGAVIGAPSQLIVTIPDDEPPPLAEFTATSLSIAETSGVATLTVLLSDLTASDVTIPFQVGGTATAGADFSIDASPLVIPAASLIGTIEIAPVVDGAPEPAETIVVTLTGATGAALGGAVTATVTLTDAPAAPCTLAYSEPEAIYGPAVVISPNVPAVGCGAATSFSVIPALPAGLSLDVATGVITGIPTVEQPAILYAITATNAAGSVQTTISIQVSPVFVLSATAPVVPYDPANGTASFDLGILLLELPSGSPAGLHEIEGLSFGLRVDAASIDVLSASEGADSLLLNGGNGADFFLANILADGITVASIVSFSFVEVLVAATPKEVLAVELASNPAFLIGNATGAVVTLPFDGTLGTPDVENLVVYDIAQSASPRRIPATVTFVP